MELFRNVKRSESENKQSFVLSTCTYMMLFPVKKGRYFGSYVKFRNVDKAGCRKIVHQNIFIAILLKAVLSSDSQKGKRFI